MSEMIDKNLIIDYLTAIKPDHAVSAYGEGVIDTINHVSRYISNMPSIGVDLVDRSTVTLKGGDPDARL